MFGSKKIYLTVTLTTIVGLLLCVWLFVVSMRSINYSTTIPTAASFVALPIRGSDTHVTIQNLPLHISLSQTLQLQAYIGRASHLPENTSVVGYFRDGSVSYESTGITLLIDIPSIKQTLSITTHSDSILSIGCASVDDQQDASWVCVDEEGVDE